VGPRADRVGTANCDLLWVQWLQLGRGGGTAKGSQLHQRTQPYSNEMECSSAVPAVCGVCLSHASGIADTKLSHDQRVATPLSARLLIQLPR
jgi:hypothetical protein